MNKISVNFADKVGKIKPMHGVNNGPCGSRGKGNFEMFEELRFPFVRTHDTALTTYYGQKVVDVHLVFDDFDKDENDAANYDFTYTDKFIADTLGVGSKIFYRLGASIEHGIKKYGTIPPKDNLKWARICEHIIDHYNNGWADGFHYNIEYWEIWNEPDCVDPNGDNPCWQGTQEEFCEFFCTVYKYLKDKFPNLKIGGPAMTSTNSDYWHPFLDAVKAHGLELDFYSYHGYLHSVTDYFTDSVAALEKMLKDHGLKRTELILNEWNYNAGWAGGDFIYSVNVIKNHKGAAFTSAMMLAMQHTALDKLMYYDARISAYNGFCETYTFNRLKSYYSFLNFKKLYDLGTDVKTVSDDKALFAVGASGENGKGIALTYFDNNDNAEAKTVALEISDALPGSKAEVFLTNEKYDNELVRIDYISTGHTVLLFTLNNFDQIYINISE